MSFLQPMNFDSAFRPVRPESSNHPNGVANRAQLCRGNDAKCCRRAGQVARPVGTGAELVWDDHAFCCPGCGGCCGQCGCQNQCEACCPREACGDCNNDCDTGCNECRTGCDNDCESTYTRRHQRSGCNNCDNDCDTGCENTYTRRQRSGCNNCDNDCDNGCDTEHTAGMVYHAEQCLEKVFCAEQALRAGTMYPDLYKPMNCADDPATNCPSEQQEKAFQLWELRLYLNTHPCDKKVLRLYRQLAKELGCPNYASTFDEDDCGAETWNWVNNPWPWECGHQRDKK